MSLHTYLRGGVRVPCWEEPDDVYLDDDEDQDEDGELIEAEFEGDRS